MTMRGEALATGREECEHLCGSCAQIAVGATDAAQHSHHSGLTAATGAVAAMHKAACLSQCLSRRWRLGTAGTASRTP